MERYPWAPLPVTNSRSCVSSQREQSFRPTFPWLCTLTVCRIHPSSPSSQFSCVCNCSMMSQCGCLGKQGMRQRPGWFCLGDDPKIRGEGVGTARRGRRDNRRLLRTLGGTRFCARVPSITPWSSGGVRERRSTGRQCVADKPEIGPSM